MKSIISFICLVFISLTIFPQQAGDYFPGQTGFMWNYKATPLDSLNNPIDSLALFRQDSFAVTQNYNGKLANIVPSKRGPLQTIQFQPYTDSLLFHLAGSDGYEHFRVGALEFFLLGVDSIISDPNFSFVNFFTELEDWYPVYKFSSAVNQQYTLISIDTVIASISPLPLRFEYLGTRLADETINTVKGTFSCKKFLISWKISLVFFPPIPPVKLLETEDTYWIAEDNWVVLDVIPTNHIDLSLLGIDPFSIPGLRTELTDQIVSVKGTNEIVPNSITLYQNYPNPFNPATTIKFTISQDGRGETREVKLIIYDVLGNEVTTLVDEEKSAGRYEIEFDGKNLSSGIYYYKLQAGNFSETKKMLLIK